MSVDLSTPIRDALLAESTITSSLTTRKGSYPIFTRRPVPDDAEFPLIVVSSGIEMGDQDGINDQRPVLVRDIIAYGSNDTSAKYRAVESLGFAVRSLFHRQRDSIVVPGWSVIDILARGPSPAPTDDEETVGRMVMLTIRLAKMN